MCLSCHVVDLEIEIKNLDALRAACQRLGWTFREGQTTYRWFGRWVDDSPVPQHILDPGEYAVVTAMSKKERKAYMTAKLGHCQHTINVPGCDYDIGVVWHDNEWKLVWDWYHKGGLNRVLGTPTHNTNPLPQAYQVELAKAAARAECQPFSETVENDGSITLRIQIQE